MCRSLIALLIAAAAPVQADTTVAAEAAIDACREPGIFPTRDGKTPSGPRWRRGKLYLYATTNTNDRYTLMARMEEKHPEGAPGQWLLCLSRRALTSGSGGWDAQAWSFEFNALDRAAGDEAARALRVVRRDRHPLGTGLTTHFRPLAARARVGEPVMVALTVENRGPDTVVFTEGGGHRGSDRENRYRIEVRKDGAPQPDVGSSMNFGGLAGYVELRPGQKRTLNAIDLKKWAAFATPGIYEVRCRYDLDLTPSTEHTWERANERWDLPVDEVVKIEIAP